MLQTETVTAGHICAHTPLLSTHLMIQPAVPNTGSSLLLLSYLTPQIDRTRSHDHATVHMVNLASDICSCRIQRQKLDQPCNLLWPSIPCCRQKISFTQATMPSMSSQKNKTFGLVPNTAPAMLYAAHMWPS